MKTLRSVSGYKSIQTAAVKLISLLIEASVNLVLFMRCRTCSYEILRFMFDPCRFSCCVMIHRQLKQMFYVVVFCLIVLLLYVVFSLRNHGKDNLLSPAERQTLNFCLFYF